MRQALEVMVSPEHKLVPYYANQDPCNYPCQPTGDRMLGHRNHLCPNTQQHPCQRDDSVARAVRHTTAGHLTL